MGSEIPPKISLTDIAARNAKPRAWPYKMGDAEGPFLPVTPAGGKLCRFRYRQAGKEKLLSIGSWPECVRHRNRNDADNLLANLHAGTWREIREERGKAGSMTANLIFRQNLSDRTRRHE